MKKFSLEKGSFSGLYKGNYGQILLSVQACNCCQTCKGSQKKTAR